MARRHFTASATLATVVFGLALAAVAPAFASTSGAFMELGDSAAAPRGFLDYCTREPAECGMKSADVAALSPLLVQVSDFGPTAALAPAPSEPRRMSLRSLDASLRGDSTDGAGDSTPAAIDMTTPSAVEDIAEDKLPDAAPAVVAWDRTLAKLLKRVNREVNREIKATSDVATFGQDEYWSRPRVLAGRKFGDCEDIALEKRRRLVALGVPQEALTLAVVMTRRGDIHAVLIARTSEGDMVLDNLSSWVDPWTKPGYLWLTRQVTGTSIAWAAVTAAG